VATGIRQGDSLSRILVNIIIDEIINEVKQAGREYGRMGEKEIQILRYADERMKLSSRKTNINFRDSCI